MTNFQFEKIVNVKNKTTKQIFFFCGFFPEISCGFQLKVNSSTPYTASYTYTTACGSTNFERESKSDGDSWDIFSCLLVFCHSNWFSKPIRTVSHFHFLFSLALAPMLIRYASHAFFGCWLIDIHLFLENLFLFGIALFSINNMPRLLTKREEELVIDSRVDNTKKFVNDRVDLAFNKFI